jgi:hypothetical protein
LPDRPGLPRRAVAELLAAEAAPGHGELGLPAQATISGLAIMGLVYQLIREPRSRAVDRIRSVPWLT